MTLDEAIDILNRHHYELILGYRWMKWETTAQLMDDANVRVLRVFLEFEAVAIAQRLERENPLEMNG